MIYGWPGNVRELRSALEFAFVIADKGLIDLDQLPPKIVKLETPIAEPGYPSKEKRMLIEALRQSNGNQTQAARILGINRETVWNRMKKYGIDLKKVLTV